MTRDRNLVRVALLLLGSLVAVSLVASLRAGDALPGGPGGQDLVPGVQRGVIVRWWALSARSALLVTAVATAVAGVLGTALGAVSVYLAGGAGVVLARLLEFGGSVPSLILVGVIRFWDPTGGAASLVATLALLRTVEVAQLVRTQVLTLLAMDFAEASRALGASRRWQLRVHVLPRLTLPLLANLAFGASSLIGLEAALGFAGLGLPPEVPSWSGALRSLVSGGSREALVWAVASLGVLSAGLYWMGARLATLSSAEASSAGVSSAQAPPAHAAGDVE